MQVKTDFHIHTDYIGCADDTMRINDIVRVCEELGMEQIAITDHLNTLDQVDTHRKIKDDLLKLNTTLTVYFGAELNFNRQNGEFAATPEIQREVGFQFFIGGIHSAYGTDRSPDTILRTQHEHHLRTCHDPLVSVLVHPYWFGASEYSKMPWLTDLSLLPAEWVHELGETAATTDTAIEINAAAILCNKQYPESFQRAYFDFLNTLKTHGVRFSLATDAHNIGQLEWIRAVEKAVNELEIPEEQVWYPDVSDIRNA